MGETDLSRLKSLLDRFEIKYIEDQNEYTGTEFEETRITFGEKEYSTIFFFDFEGKYIDLLIE
jgi:hypothetical protein